MVELIENKMGAVIAVCPACGKKYRKDDKLVSSTQLVMVPGRPEPQVEMLQIVCIACGVKFFPPEILKAIKEAQKKGGNKIIIPQNKPNIPRMN